MKFDEINLLQRLFEHEVEFVIVGGDSGKEATGTIATLRRYSLTRMFEQSLFAFYLRRTRQVSMNKRLGIE